MEDILVDREELRKTAESFNGFMPVDKTTVIALLDALDEAEKLWDIKEWPCQTHLRAKTMEKHLEQIQTMFGDKLDSPLQQQNRELILENTRLRKALEWIDNNMCPCDSMPKGCDDNGCMQKQKAAEALH